MMMTSTTAPSTPPSVATTTSHTVTTAPVTLQTIPKEVQLNLFSYLRAYDLTAVQQTCRFYNDPDFIDSLVQHAAEQVYSPQFTKDILIEAGDRQNNKTQNFKYTLEHLRNIELTVVARVLSLPEPKHGFYVSKAWIKKTLLWLETVHEPPRKKKLNKKQQRQRDRRLSDVSPPWPNVNSDIVCCHQNLQRCGAKAARSRRRLLDKQAWKILKKLYPDSTQLESVSGECLQCLMETETARKNEQDRLEQEKIERKRPLADPLVRRFYTRTRGVPQDCLVSESLFDSAATAAALSSCSPCHLCPLKSGTYVIIPRAWCHQWRRFMKTGEGGMPTPPDSSALLCDAHKYALLPPHLEAFLHGETFQLLSTIRANCCDTPQSPTTPVASSIPVGMQPSIDFDTMNALMAAGITETELAAQRLAMLQLQQDQDDQTGPTVANRESAAAAAASLNDMLDRENHVVVELVTLDEWTALQETGGWPKLLTHFAVTVTVRDDQSFYFSTNPCRECDPTGSRFLAQAEVKYRRKRWEPKCVEQKRIPRVEY